MDPAFKARFLSEPAAVLAEHGIEFSPGVEVRAVENTDRVTYIGLPPPPPDDVSEEDLQLVAGGAATASTAGSAGTFGTFSCPAGTVSSAFSAGSAGTLGG
jgi:hypothetical protein